MQRLQELIRLHRSGISSREVARLLQISPNTERSFRLLFAQHNVLHGPLTSLPDAAYLRELVEQARPHKRPLQHESSVEQWLATITKFVHDGVQPKAIFDWLRLHEKDFNGSLSAIKRCVHHVQKAQGVRESDVAIRVETPPGLVAQVDFGAVGKFRCPKTNILRQAYVFIMVLSHSRHMFAKIVLDQTIQTWLALHAAAFTFFGGVVTTVVPDNLKSAVIHAAFDVRSESTLNLSYRDLARHYGFTIDPTPPYSPEKKGKVEAAVKYVQTNFIATLQNRDSLEHANAQLEQWVLKVAGERHHATIGEPPLSRFERTERSALRALPKKSWQHVEWRRLKVHRDSHIHLDGAAYSVPWRLLGKMVLVRLVGSSVEIYWEDTRVATHERTATGTSQTNDAHLPEARRDYRHRDPAYWRERASALHADIGAYIDEVLTSDTVQSQITKVAAMVRLFEQEGVERARATCRRASYYGNYSYSAVKKILQEQLDQQPLPIALVFEPHEHPIPKFARSLSQFLETAKASADASN